MKASMHSFNSDDSNKKGDNNAPYTNKDSS